MGQRPSALTNDNPYVPPAHAKTIGLSQVAEDGPPNGVGNQRRFRWQTVPAGLSWFVAALLAIGSIFWFWQFFVVVFDKDGEKYFRFIAASMASVLLIASILNFVGGRKWMIGQCTNALFMNAASIGIIFGVATLLERYVLLQ